MDNEPVKILLIEDNPGSARLIREMLSEAEGSTFDFECCDRLSRGLEHLNSAEVHLVLLDLNLPDSCGIDTFAKVHAHAPRVPIIVLTNIDDEAIAVKTVQDGAQDNLVKGQIYSNSLHRSVHYAIERQRIQEKLQTLSITDELTGLYNRRGFFLLAGRYLELVNRSRDTLLLAIADLDGMKQINDTFGHHEGDLALIGAANVLRKSCLRETDLVARVGGDEFAIAVMETSKAADGILVARLQKNLDAENSKQEHPYELSMSTGVVRYRSERPCSIEDLMVRADKLMYAQKQGKQMV